jgi:TonB family protein
MSSDPADLKVTGADSSPVPGWGPARWTLLLALALAAHFGLVFLLGAWKAPAQRVLERVPQFHLATQDDELLALTDPTLFALPHEAMDFFPAEWRRPPAVAEHYFSWTEKPLFLSVRADELGSDFEAFMQTNPVPAPPLNFKPAPQLAQPDIRLKSNLPSHSTWELSPELAARLIDRPDLPALNKNDTLPPSRVQVLVDAGGLVFSAVLLDSSGWETADKMALAISQKMKFEPAQSAVFGTITFHWRTRPEPTP